MKRKATKSALKNLLKFPDYRLSFFTRIIAEVESNKIPWQMVINWNQIDLKLVLVSSWIMAEEGSKQVPVVGKDHNFEITAFWQLQQ